MIDYICINLEIPEFYKLIYSSKNLIPKVHHCHLFTNNNEIEMRLFFEKETNFMDLFFAWTNIVDMTNFGKYLNVSIDNNNLDKRITSIDISNAALKNVNYSSLNIEDGRNFLILNFDTIRIFRKNHFKNINTAEFYLEDKGFRIVKSFYSILTPDSYNENDNVFSFGKMDQTEDFFKIGIANFIPNFYYASKDNRNNRIATITKHPKIDFKFLSSISLEDVVKYGDLVLILSSFFHHINIEYFRTCIYFVDYSVTILKVEEENFLDFAGGLGRLGIHGNLNNFLKLCCNDVTLVNYNLIKKIVQMFNQSHIVDDYSSFLIRYNIIEICDKSKPENVKFNYKFKKRNSKIFSEALKIILQNVHDDEHEDFVKRWENVKTLLQNKPMKNNLNRFLLQQNIDISIFPIQIETLITLRNNITHGSLNKISQSELHEANKMLYQICGALILNIMNIHNWKLK